MTSVRTRRQMISWVHGPRRSSDTLVTSPATMAIMRTTGGPAGVGAISPPFSSLGGLSPEHPNQTSSAARPHITVPHVDSTPGPHPQPSCSAASVSALCRPISSRFPVWPTDSQPSRFSIDAPLGQSHMPYTFRKSLCYSTQSRPFLDVPCVMLFISSCGYKESPSSWKRNARNYRRVYGYRLYWGRTPLLRTVMGIYRPV